MLGKPNIEEQEAKTRTKQQANDRGAGARDINVEAFPWDPPLDFLPFCWPAPSDFLHVSAPGGVGIEPRTFGLQEHVPYH